MIDRQHALKKLKHGKLSLLYAYETKKKQKIIKKMKLEKEISKCRNLDESNLYVKAD